MEKKLLKLHTSDYDQKFPEFFFQKPKFHSNKFMKGTITYEKNLKWQKTRLLIWTLSERELVVSYPFVLRWKKIDKIFPFFALKLLVSSVLRTRLSLWDNVSKKSLIGKRKQFCSFVGNPVFSYCQKWAIFIDEKKLC